MRTLFAATTVAIASVLLFGLAPAVTTTGFDVLPSLKDESATSTASYRTALLRRAFVTAQVALSLVLTIGAGLFVQSLSRAMRVDPGFDPTPSSRCRLTWIFRATRPIAARRSHPDSSSSRRPFLA